MPAHSRPRLAVLLLPTLVLVATGCQQKLTGPAPSVATPAAGKPLPVAPGIVCADQLTTQVTVKGSGFSPVPVNIPGEPGTALPTLSLVPKTGLDGTGKGGAAVTFSGEPGGTNESHLTWQSQSQMTFTVDQALKGSGTTGGAMQPGIYDVQVKNPNANEATSQGALAVAPKPTVTDLTPGIICVAQADRQITLTGTTFLQIEGSTPTLTSDASTFDQVSLDGCSDVAQKAITAQTCTQATFTVPMGALDPGAHALTLDNPETAACHSEETVNLMVVPPPAITSVDPSLACTDQGDRQVVLNGSGFLTIDGALPAATLGGTAVTVDSAGDCSDLAVTGKTVQTCNTLTLTIPQQTNADPIAPDIVVTNPDPAGCNGTATAQLVLTPKPTVTDVQPPVVCNTGGPASLTLTGTHFLSIDGTPPTVTLNGTAVPANGVVTSNCTPLDPAAPGHTVDDCTTLTATFSSATVTGPDVTVAVTNPDPAGCDDTWSATLPLVDPPTVTAAAPVMVCTADGDQQVVLTGTGFLEIGGAEPTVTFDGTTGTAVTAQNCTADTIGTTSVNRCTQLTVTAPMGAMTPGLGDVQVTNPAPLACSGGSQTVLAEAPALTVTAVTPAGVCATSPDADLDIQGTGFLTDGTTPPAVSLTDSAGTTYTPATVTPSNCTALSFPAGMQACTDLTVTLPSGTLVEGDVTVTVTNAGGASCTKAATGVFFVNPKPTIASVTPVEFCTDLGGTLDIVGTGFTAGTRVNLIDKNGTSFPSSQLTLVSATELQATFAPALLPGPYTLQVTNGPSCDDTTAPITIDPEPTVFFVDPPQVYNGINVQATVYTTGLTAAASKIELVDSTGATTQLTGSPYPGQPNRTLVTIPAGLTAGKYDIRVTSQTGCVGSLTQGLTVTDTLTLALKDIAPAYVSTNLATAVTITATTPPPAGQVDFQQTPRAYLNPTNASSTTVASELHAVVYVDAGTLTAVVPKGLPVGDYDLIVTNPDGSSGLLQAAVHVVATDPPIITAIAPGSVAANATTPATLLGRNFDTSGALTLGVTCTDPAGVVYQGPATANTVTPTSIDASFDATAWVSATATNAPAGSVCVVRVTNGDGAYFDYSAISVKLPSGNLHAWSAATSMVEPREGLSLAAGRPTYTSRYLYAIGGDDPNAVAPVEVTKTSVESASVDVFGTMGPWQIQRNRLPAPRTHAAMAKVGQFVYLLGGDDGTGVPTSTVYRAQILDPLATPTVTDISLTVGDTGGVAPGFWYYRISATFPATDPSNPGGESLPGEVQVVQLPATNGIQLVLTWDQIPGATGYRVYRTPNADLSPADVQLLASVQGGTNTTYTDSGATTDPTQTPLPPGSLGVWHDAGVGLGTARSGLAATAAADQATANTFYVYAIGGRDLTGTPLATAEYFTVTVTPPAQPKGREAQAITADGATTGSLGTARADIGAATATFEDMPVIAQGTTYLWVGPGATATGDSRAVESSSPDASGDLPAFTAQSNAGTQTGAGFLQGNGYLYLFGGGTGGAPSTTSTSVEVCTGAGAGCTGGPPETHNWNALGNGAIATPRAFMGSAEESAFFFIAGGNTGTTVTNTVITTAK